MKVFVAGATGAIGRPLVLQLLAAGHEVVGTTRTPERADWLREAGAEAVMLDLNDTAATRRAVLAAEPEAVMDQTTDLPRKFKTTRTQMNRFYERYVALRQAGSPALLDAAIEAGARRFIFQSVAFVYAPGDGQPKTEDSPLFVDNPPKPWDRTLPPLFELEQRVMNAETIEGMVLRFGYFYGPLTHYGPGGQIHADVRKRRFPIVGNGAGIFPFIHVADGAEASILALDRGRPGIYNVADDDPAPVRVWLPEYARQVGAKPPRKVPGFLAGIFSGPLTSYWTTQQPAVSNAKAKAELGWQPRLSSWRSGFRTALDSYGPGRPAGREKTRAGG